MPLLVIYNPVCGHGTAKELFEHAVLPTLRDHGRVPDRVEATTHEGHAGEIVRDFLDSLDAQPGEVTVVLGSGDGTLHEIVSALHASKSSRSPNEHHEIAVVLVPCGTANALYSSLFPPRAGDAEADSTLGEGKDALKLKSLHAFLDPASTTTRRPLSLATTRILPDPAVGNAATAESVSAVVASTSLHASILHDSEALRATHPGIERFKLAAQQNISRWYHASVRLLPPVSLYTLGGTSPGFVAHEETKLEGPFAYFLSTLNVDRLEPFFRITPLHTALPPPPSPPAAPTLDLVVVRPFRDRTVKDETQSTRDEFVKKSVAVLTAAYQDGAHVQMVYGKDGEVAPASASGEQQESVVEYFRCGGWEWIPHDEDDSAHLVCADGEIFRIGDGGKAVCVVSQVVDGVSFSVYA